MLLKICPIERGFYFMNIKFIVLVFLGIFFGCLGLSKLADHCFGVSSDYLTATATFFAAFIALYLYNDWRVEHKIKLLESYQSNLKSKTSKLLPTSLKAKSYLFLIVGSSVKEGYQHFQNALNETNTFLEILKSINEDMSGYILLLSHLENTKEVKANIETCTFFSEKLKKIYQECMFKMYENNNSININSLKEDDFFKWNKDLREFDYLVSYQLVEFYIKYLNSLK